MIGTDEQAERFARRVATESPWRIEFARREIHAARSHGALTSFDEIERLTWDCIRAGVAVTLALSVVNGDAA